MNELTREPAQADPLPFPIQGSGEQTRSFIYIDDFLDGLMLLLEKGRHLEIYNIGTSEEVAIGELARLVAECYGRRVRLETGDPAEGGTLRRCPNIRKISALGFQPKIPLRKGVGLAVSWYRRNSERFAVKGGAQ